MSSQGFLSRRVLDWLFMLQVVLVVGVLLVLTTYTVQTANQVQVISQRQIDYVAQQNNLQLCAQHDIIVATRQIARSLGLPTRGIVVPDVTGLPCP